MTFYESQDRTNYAAQSSVDHDSWRADRAHGQAVLQARIEILLDEALIARVDRMEADDVRNTLIDAVSAERYAGDFSPLLPKVRALKIGEPG